MNIVDLFAFAFALRYSHMQCIHTKLYKRDTWISIVQSLTVTVSCISFVTLSAYSDPAHTRMRILSRNAHARDTPGGIIHTHMH